MHFHLNAGLWAALLALTSLQPCSADKPVDLIVRPNGGNVSSPIMYGLMHEVLFPALALTPAGLNSLAHKYYRTSTTLAMAASMPSSSATALSSRATSPVTQLPSTVGRQSMVPNSV